MITSRTVQLYRQFRYDTAPHFETLKNIHKMKWKIPVKQKHRHTDTSKTSARRNTIGIGVGFYVGLKQYENNRFLAHSGMGVQTAGEVTARQASRVKLQRTAHKRTEPPAPPKFGRKVADSTTNTHRGEVLYVEPHFLIPSSRGTHKGNVLDPVAGQN